MEKEPLISVIVPVYNQEKLLRRCVSSIISQNYSNLEIILVNDGSTDNSLKVCRSFSDNRIKVIDQANSGVSVARNNGLHHAKGELIAFVDPDDMLDKKYFNILVSQVVSDKIDIVACGATVLLDNNQRKENNFYKSNFIAKNAFEKKKLFLQLMQSSYAQPSNSIKITAIGVPWGKLYRKKMLDQFDIVFDSVLRRMQDNIFNMYAFQAARIIKYINQPLYIYSAENIANYMHSHYKYLPHHLNNIKKFMEHRYLFMCKNNLWNDTTYRTFYENEALAMINSALNLNILNSENKTELKSKNVEIEELFKSKRFNVATNLKLKDINGFSTKLVYFAMKINNPLLLIMIWKFKFLISNK